jgi:hypothetical protein
MLVVFKSCVERDDVLMLQLAVDSDLPLHLYILCNCKESLEDEHL